MKLQKLQRARVGRQMPKADSARLPPFNQTIIINNPNININYLGDGTRDNQPLSSRGLDNWHLNNNLKQFGQTRQLGFFHHHRHNDRNKSNSPYIIHKVRTQDIRNINKIYGAKPTKDALAHFHKNQTVAHIGRQEEKAEPSPPSVLEKIIAKQDKTHAEKFYHHPKKNAKLELHKNFETLPTTFLASHLPNPEAHPKTFRKNRFQVAGQNIAVLTERVPPSQEGSIIDSQLIQRKEQQDQQEEEARFEPRGLAPRLVPLEMRKRAFNKTIQSINKGLLSQTDSYLDRTFAERVPQSQIELCVNSLSHPERNQSLNERSSQRCFNDWMQYDFHFDEQRKRRPKTPKRKMPYGPNQ